MGLLLCCLPMKLEHLNKTEVHMGIHLVKYVTVIAVISLFRWLLVMVTFLSSALYFLLHWWLLANSAQLTFSFSSLFLSSMLHSVLFFYLRQIYIKFLYHLQMPNVAERPEVSWACIFYWECPHSEHVGPALCIIGKKLDFVWVF